MFKKCKECGHKDDLKMREKIIFLIVFVAVIILGTECSKSFASLEFKDDIYFKLSNEGYILSIHFGNEFTDVLQPTDDIHKVKPGFKVPLDKIILGQTKAYLNMFQEIIAIRAKTWAAEYHTPCHTAVRKWGV